MPLTPPLTPSYRLRSWQPSDASLLKQNKKHISRSLITIGSGNSGSGHTTSSFTKSRTTSPPPRVPGPVFGSPLRRSAGLAEEEEEYMAVHGHWRVNVDECVELERATRKGEESHVSISTNGGSASASRSCSRTREAPDSRILR